MRRCYEQDWRISCYPERAPGRRGGSPRRESFDERVCPFRVIRLQQTTREGYTIEVPGIVPKLSGTPGSLRTPAPGLGEDTDAVLLQMGLSRENIAELRSKGVVA